MDKFILIIVCLYLVVLASNMSVLDRVIIPMLCLIIVTIDSFKKENKNERNKERFNEKN